MESSLTPAIPSVVHLKTTSARIYHQTFSLSVVLTFPGIGIDSPPVASELESLEGISKCGCRPIPLCWQLGASLFHDSSKRSRNSWVKSETINNGARFHPADHGWPIAKRGKEAALPISNQIESAE